MIPGRWWGGFLLIGSVLLLPSVALFFFRAPEISEKDSSNGTAVPKRRLALVDRHLERQANGKTVPDGASAKFREFFDTISTVLKQPIYRWTVTGRIIDVLGFKGKPSSDCQVLL
jgi:hypothetical protein